MKEQYALEQEAESVKSRANASTPVNEGGKGVTMASPENVYSIRKTIPGPSQENDGDVEPEDPDRTLIVDDPPSHEGEVELVRDPERPR